MFDDSTHKFIAAMIAACFVALFALLVVVAVTTTNEHARVGEARAAACAQRHANPRDIAICIKLTK